MNPLIYENGGGGTLKVTLGTNPAVRLSVSGAVTLDGGTLALNDTPSNTVGKYRLIQAAGTLSGSFSSTPVLTGTPFRLAVTTGAGGKVDLIQKASLGSLSLTGTPASASIITGWLWIIGGSTRAGIYMRRVWQHSRINSSSGPWRS